MRVGNRNPLLAPDAELIRKLAELLAETGLTEIEYAVGDRRIRVARNPAAVPAATVATVPLPSSIGESSIVRPPAAHADIATQPGAVTSPMVGIAYLAPEPGAPPFVRNGDAVSEGQTLLIIEAMKVMNQIRSPRAGRLARILVEDAAPVEYGAPLMLIE
ncbi:MAG: acetyl-CoA carboxylase biotin carboxyl carrier protein [Alphaproteobacteria bacterium]|nr:acetyl-CoA carboxylase biotin carboxyl carrier protein [Alphaproteobacteria bacterium]